MKKIGVLFGQETIFPQALIERINQQNNKGIHAEAVVIDKVIQGQDAGYAVILDRISHHVPFYRSWLKHAALNGAVVLNNPFWWSADEKFVNNELALKAGLQVPKTVLLPTFDHPAHTTSDSFRNLAYPFDWDAIFAYTGFPAYLKPLSDGGWRNVHRVTSAEECFHRHAATGHQVMLLQEEIHFESYYRCFYIGGQVRIMPYDPRRLHQHRYEADFTPDEQLQQTLVKQVSKLNEYLGYDINTVEIAVHQGVPYAIDFFNPAPEADIHTIGEANFEWIVAATAAFLVEKAKAAATKKSEAKLTWGSFLQENAQAGTEKKVTEKKAVEKKSAEKKAAAKAPAKKKEDAPVKAKKVKPKEA